MVEVARGGMTRRQFREMFHSGDHSTVRKVAPAHGLCLVAVGY
jgi:tRNA U38,U39,U40 pseudouridine synthase TruA